ncbi:hypothetical protein C2845_PM14G04910 [Panicum miliaceum]|uniref:F-box domain-containing protein n=1 Tax=Panicum miliaceum TaxID=4540 RepID=A0A3L6PVF8_PANMI|nr:hypothetical protein C2845_PM14G04910 [Panicum miliaceum]
MGIDVASLHDDGPYGATEGRDAGILAPKCQASKNGLRGAYYSTSKGEREKSRHHFDSPRVWREGGRRQATCSTQCASRRRRAGEEGAPDSLSALLHRVLSPLRAWEVVRTCVLARRWRHLWASAPCVDLRLRPSRDDGAPEEFPRFVRRLLRGRDASAAVDTLRLRSSDADGAFDEDDARSWIRTAIKRKARVVHLIGHRNGLAALEHAAFVSRHLKILNLSYAQLDDNILRQLSSRCPSLEEMDLKDCLISGNEISSSSLKTLAMVNCNMFWGLSITAPNLLLLRCVKPIGQAPSFKNLGSLVAGTIILDDYCFSDDFEDFSKDELHETTDDDESDDTRDDKKRHMPGGYKGANDYGSDIERDDNTFEYSDIAND